MCSRGRPGPYATAKDVALALLKHFGANGLLDYSAELYGDYADSLTLDQRITISSLATEMAAIILLIPPSPAVLQHCRPGAELVYADPDAHYDKVVEIDIASLEPLIARPATPKMWSRSGRSRAVRLTPVSSAPAPTAGWRT